MRTKEFALRVIKLVSALPRGAVGDVLGRQLLKAATSVGANYREALRASSRRHSTSIIEITAREADEALYWLELLAESGVMKPSRLSKLIEECGELVAIFASTAKTTRNTTGTTANPKSQIPNPKS
jgi:four helix bundle protein